MSIRDIDLDPDKAFGIGFPLNYDRNRDNGFFEQNYTYHKQLQDNIKTLLSTGMGERPMYGDFGCRLKEVVFEQNEPDILKAGVEESIREALDNYLPFVTLVETKLFANNNTLNILGVFKSEFNEQVIEQIIQFEADQQTMDELDPAQP